jgi:hypothetical protein
MTESNRLGEYVTFLQETLAKITRVVQTKTKRSEQRKRKPRMHRKSSFIEIMATSGGGLTRMRTAPLKSINQKDGVSRDGTEGHGAGEASTSAGGGAEGGGTHGTVSVHLQRVLAVQHSGLGGMDDTASIDQFVEVLDRRGIYNQRGTAQHVVIDPLVFERQFQDKWKRPARALALSTEDALRESHPLSNKYVPPLSIARLHTSPSTSSHSVSSLVVDRHCHSIPALLLKEFSRTNELDVEAELKAARAFRNERDADDVALRRSLSAVTLQKRIQENKTQADRAVSTKETQKSKRQVGAVDPPLYLAIST